VAKNFQKQSGSAHVIVIVILILALLGTLGFIFWQNFINDDSSKAVTRPVNTSGSQEVDVKEAENKVYDDSELTFEYPATGWNLVDTSGPDDIARLETDNYTPSIGMGLDAGASLLLYRTNQQEVPSFPGVKDVEEINVDGNKGFKYSVEYEGYRINTFFTVGIGTSSEKNYAISMQTVGVATDLEREAFGVVIKSLDIK